MAKKTNPLKTVEKKAARIADDADKIRELVSNYRAARTQRAYARRMLNSIGREVGYHFSEYSNEELQEFFGKLKDYASTDALKAQYAGRIGKLEGELKDALDEVSDLSSEKRAAVRKGTKLADAVRKLATQMHYRGSLQHLTPAELSGIQTYVGNRMRHFGQIEREFDQVSKDNDALRAWKMGFETALQEGYHLNADKDPKRTLINLEGAIRSALANDYMDLESLRTPMDAVRSWAVDSQLYASIEDAKQAQSGEVLTLAFNGMIGQLDGAIRTHDELTQARDTATGERDRLSQERDAFLTDVRNVLVGNELFSQEGVNAVQEYRHVLGLMNAIVISLLQGKEDYRTLNDRFNAAQAALTNANSAIAGLEADVQQKTADLDAQRQEAIDLRRDYNTVLTDIFGDPMVQGEWPQVVKSAGSAAEIPASARSALHYFKDRVWAMEQDARDARDELVNERNRGNSLEAALDERREERDAYRDALGDQTAELGRALDRERTYQSGIGQQDEHIDELLQRNGELRNHPQFEDLVAAFREHLGLRTDENEPYHCAERIVAAISNRIQAMDHNAIAGPADVGYTPIDGQRAIELVKLFGKRSPEYMSGIRDAAALVIERLDPKTFWGRWTPFKQLRKALEKVPADVDVVEAARAAIGQL